MYCIEYLSEFSYIDTYYTHIIPFTTRQFMATITFTLGALDGAVQSSTASFQANDIINRLWKKDHTIWRSEEVHKKSILNRLGWLSSVQLMQAHLDEVTAFAGAIKDAGFTHAVVLGMGGSSLCPDVCRATFGSAPGFPQLLVLDSTNPASVERIEKSIELQTTLFIVASKSGGTTETNMFYQYFYDRVGGVKKNPGENFVAVTDGGTKMEAIAKEKHFRKIFVNPEDIGGRFSALSYFGIVPMAIIGMDVRLLLENAAAEIARCKNSDMSSNAAARIGIAMAEAYKAGTDKLTFIASPEISTFGYWTEQLIAESTGKEGKGIVPIEGEPLPATQAATAFSNDRLFVFLLTESSAPVSEPFRQNLIAAGRPCITIVLKDAYELGGEFFRWEFATSSAAVVMEINPFDEPNVKESKDNTVRVIDEYKATGTLPKKTNVAIKGHLDFICENDYAAKLKTTAKSDTVEKLLRTHLAGSASYDYIAILAYVDQNESHLKLLQTFRAKVRTLTGCAVTLGFGPRYLHSTGQLHKGGRPNGIFLLITADETVDAKIPGELFTFEVLKNAQALGDYHSLASRSFRLAQIHLGRSIEKGLNDIIAMV
jgi:transaldolase / glucose-6-phosphate isomerase